MASIKCWGRVEITISPARSGGFRFNETVGSVLRALPGCEYWQWLSSQSLSYAHDRLEMVFVAAESYGADAKQCRDAVKSWLSRVAPEAHISALAVTFD
jgi:hypothetical protein